MNSGVYIHTLPLYLHRDGFRDLNLSYSWFLENITFDDFNFFSDSFLFIQLYIVKVCYVVMIQLDVLTT